MKGPQIIRNLNSPGKGGAETLDKHPQDVGGMAEKPGQELET